jgi:TolB-like protein/Tfp pilus assembly protein PilF
MADRAESETTQGPAATEAVARVFISYASPDKNAADAIVAALERRGIQCWIAPRDVTPGLFYADAIVQAINSTQLLIVVLSVNSIGSQHVLREVERASAKRHPVVALRLDISPLPTGLEYFLSASHWLDASGGTIERALPELLDAVHRLLGSLAKPMVNTSIRGESNVIATGGAAPAGGNTSKQRSNRLWTTTAVLAVVLCALLAGKFWLSKPPTIERPAATTSAPAILDKSIAVLPFTDMSEKKDQEYFADGMAEEILDLLVKIPGLKVIARTSSFQFKGQNVDLRTIGEKLGARYVLEGSVRKSGDRLRVTAQLIDSRDGSHLFSDTYDRQMGDVLKMQEDIALALARALQITVNADVPLYHSLKNTDAYDLNLRGRMSLNRFDTEGFSEAVRYFQQARALDPTFADTAGWLSAAYLLQGMWGFMPPATAFENSRREALAALKLDPQFAAAHAILGAVHTVYDWDWSAADAELNKALNLAPQDAVILSLAGQQSMAVGRWDEALRQFTASLAQDPLDPGVWITLYWIQMRMGHIADAEASVRRALEIAPMYTNAHYWLGLILIERGQLDESLAEMQQETLEGNRLLGIAIASHALGRKAQSDAALAEMLKTDADDNAFGIAEVYAFRGQKDQAFRWLDRAYGQKDVSLYYIKGDPPLKNLQGDPRYKAYLRKMNLPD